MEEIQKISQYYDCSISYAELLMKGKDLHSLEDVISYFKRKEYYEKQVEFESGSRLSEQEEYLIEKEKEERERQEFKKMEEANEEEYKEYIRRLKRRKHLTQEEEKILDNHKRKSKKNI